MSLSPSRVLFRDLIYILTSTQVLKAGAICFAFLCFYASLYFFKHFYIFKTFFYVFKRFCIFWSFAFLLYFAFFVLIAGAQVFFIFVLFVLFTFFVRKWLRVVKIYLHAKFWAFSSKIERVREAIIKKNGQTWEKVQTSLTPPPCQLGNP